MSTYHLSYLFLTYWWQIFHQKNYYITIFVLMNSQKFPEDIQCIVEPVQGCGGIFVSNIQAAENPLTLKKLGIEAVITAIKGKNLDKVIPQHIEYMYIPAVDHEAFDISYYFEQSNNFIEEERKRTNVLVHCMAGVSRSVALVIAYLIRHSNMSYNDAYAFVKSKRKIIHPNDSFIKQLKNYEKQFKGSNIENKYIEVQNKIPQILKQWPRKIEEKIRHSHQPTSKHQKQNQIAVNYDQCLKSSIKMLFKQKQSHLGFRV